MRRACLLLPFRLSTPVFIDRPLCDAFWRAYLTQLPREHPHHRAKPDAFGFGDKPDLADELAALVLAGQKRATTSLPVEFSSLGEALPRAGDLSIIVRGNGSPAALIERTHVEARAFDDVDQRYASTEGEGDGSLASWRRDHSEYFGDVSRRHGGSFDGRTTVLCQVFRVVWPAANALEEVARVGLAGWVGESHDDWDSPRVLGTIGDDLVLVEIDADNRERILQELIDHCQADDRGLRIEIAFFGDAGGFFASSLEFLDAWPKSISDLPAEVFIDHHHKASLIAAGDQIVVSVRHALRRGGGPPKRQFRFDPSKYQDAMSELARESKRLRADLLALAQQHAPHKLEALREAFKHWPA